VIAIGAHSLLLFQQSIRRTVRVPRVLGAVIALPALLLWVTLQVFGELPHRISNFPDRSYLMFAAPAFAVAGVVPLALFIGTTLFEDRDMGIVEHLLATPASHVAILLGRLLALVACSIVGTLVVLLSAALGGFSAGGFGHVLAIASLSALVAIVYGASGAALAFSLRRRPLLTACTTLLLLCSLIISDLLLPASLLPSWLMEMANLNPTTYAIRGARLVIQASPDWTAYEHDVLVLVIVASLCVSIAQVAFRRCDEMQW
jgi:ABC-2 type transport system permease protein